MHCHITGSITLVLAILNSIGSSPYRLTICHCLYNVDVVLRISSVTPRNDTNQEKWNSMTMMMTTVAKWQIIKTFGSGTNLSDTVSHVWDGSSLHKWCPQYSMLSSNSETVFRGVAHECWLCIQRIYYSSSILEFSMRTICIDHVLVESFRIYIYSSYAKANTQ